MERIISLLVSAVVICALVSGCSGSDNSSSSDVVIDETVVSDSRDLQETENTAVSDGQELQEIDNADESDSQSTQEMENTEGAFEDADASDLAEENVQENEEQNMEDDKMYIKIGEHTLTATMADNSSAQALLAKLKDGDITINAHDFSNFEKVGELGFSLPTNNEQITTQAGDLILYQGSNFVLYYDTNSWNFTRLGRVEGVTQKELKQILGKGDVTMVLSLNK